MADQSLQLPFFVYGTLLPGEANYFLWREAIAGYQLALIAGARLYDLGHFPMLIDAPEGEVRGMLVRVRPASYRAALSVLDQLEGIDLLPFNSPGYKRVRRLVWPMGASPVVAWVYMGAATFVAGRTQIGDDWKSHARRLVKPL